MTEEHSTSKRSTIPSNQDETLDREHSTLDNRVLELLKEYEERKQNGESITVETLCADCPSLVPEVEKGLKMLEFFQQHATPPKVDDPEETVTQPERKARVSPLPQYSLEDRLGAGGFGEVWKANGPGGFQVALKFVSLDDKHGEIERRSLEVMKNIRHANLLPVFGAWIIDDELIVAMELADGTLLDRLREAQAEGLAGIPRDELIEYMHETAKGLDYLQEPRHVTATGEKVAIQHKDIKPQNILLVGGSAKVGDFGLAKLLENTLATASGALTPAYAAPELFSGKPSRWTDQYALAVTYCLLRGGQRPFRGNIATIIGGHLHQAPDLSMLPDSERPVVRRALAKRPELRWPNCREFVRALQSAFTSVDVLAPAPAVENLAQEIRRLGGKVQLDDGDETIVGIDFSYSDITDSDLEMLAHLRELRELRLFSCRRIGDDGVQHLRAIPSLRTLSLSCTGVTNRGLPALTDLPMLEELRLFGCGGVTDSGVDVLGECPRLRKLDLTRTPVTDDCLSAFSEFPALESLDLSQTPIIGWGLGNLARAGRLRELNLSGIQLQVTTLRHLGKLPELASLDLSNDALGDDALEILSGMPELTGLDLTSNLVTDEGLHHLSGLRKLEYLALESMPIGERPLNMLPGARLHTLLLGSTRVTDEALHCLPRMRDLRHLRLARTPVTDEGLGHLYVHLRLERLDLSGSGVGTKKLAPIAQLTSLRDLRVDTCKHLSDECAPALARLPNLEQLDLGKTKLSSAGLNVLLESLVRLRSLSAPFTGVCNACLEAFRDKNTLTDLNLAYTQVSDHGVQCLRGLPNLKSLNLSGTYVTEEIVDVLRSLPSLRRLWVSDARFSLDASMQLGSMLPNTAINPE